MTATLIMLALKSLLVAALALGALRLTRGRSAAERSTIAHLGLFALVALPLASLLLPSLSLPVLPAQMPPPAQISAAAPMSPATSATTSPAGTPARVAAVHEATATPVADTPAIAERAADLARYAYLLPAAALLVLTLIALLRLIGLRSRAEIVIDAYWLGALGRAQHRMGFKNGTALLTSSDLRSPISWGLLRPTILINGDALAASDQAEAIIAHELAHVIQLDWAKLMLARVATAMFWFNPLVWVLALEAHQLREEAADDAVLAANVQGTDYAELLVGIARHENNGLLLGAHGVAPARNSLRRRVARVLDKTPARGPSGASWVAGFTAGMMVMAAPLAAVSFSPARAKEDPAEQVQRPTAPPSSWSTRAGEAPNQIQAPTAVRQGGRDVASALAEAVNGLHADPARAADPVRAANPASARIDPPETALVPGTPEFAAAWASYGRAIGSRIARAFSVNPVAPAGPAPLATAAPLAAAAPQRPFDFDYDQFSAIWGNGKTQSQADKDALVGLPDGYRKEIADAGFADISSGELLRARSVGVSGDYIQSMRRAGINGSLLTYGQARANGLQPSFVQSMRDAGIDGSVGDYIRARDKGLTGGYVQSLRDAGLNVTLNDYIQAKSIGLSGGYVRAMKSVGINCSVLDYGMMHNAGVTSRFVQALRDRGNPTADPRELVRLMARGYDPYNPRSGDP